MSVDALLADPSIEIVLNLTPPTAHAGGDARRPSPPASTSTPRSRSRRSRDDARGDPGRRPTRRASASAGRPTRSSAAGCRPRARSSTRATIGEPSGRERGGRCTSAPSAGTRTRPSSTAAAAVRCSMSGRTTSRRSCTCSGRSRGRGGRARRRRRAADRDRARGPARPFPVEVPTYGDRRVHLRVGGDRRAHGVVRRRGEHGCRTSRSTARAGRSSWAIRTGSTGASGCIGVDGDGWEDVPLALRSAAIGRGIGLADMIEAIRDDRPARASGAFAYHVLDVLLATEEAAAERPHRPRSRAPASGRRRCRVSARRQARRRSVSSSRSMSSSVER